MLPQPVKHGIAPAMGADPRLPYWGNYPNIEKDSEKMTTRDAKMFGCSSNTLPPDCRQVIEACGEKYNARQLTQSLTGHDGDKYQLPLPDACAEKAPDEINCYGDGSLLNT